MRIPSNPNPATLNYQRPVRPPEGEPPEPIDPSDLALGAVRGLSNGAAVGILGSVGYLALNGFGVIMGSPGLTQRYQPAVDAAVQFIWKAGLAGAAVGGVAGLGLSMAGDGQPSRPEGAHLTHGVMAGAFALGAAVQFAGAASPGNWHKLPLAVACSGLALSSATRLLEGL